MPTATRQSAKAFLIFLLQNFFADCLDGQVAKAISIFFRKKFFAGCFYWQVAKNSLLIAFICMCKGFFADCLYWQVAKDSFLFVFCIPSKQTENIYNRHHIYTINNTYISQTSRTYHKCHCSTIILPPAHAS